MKLTVPQLAALAARHGCPADRVPMAVAVAMLESGGDPDAVGDVNRPQQGCTSVGLWQINSCPKRDARSGAPRFGSEPARLKDPDTNAESARVISGNWQNWKPWSTATRAKVLAPTIARQLAAEPASSEPTPSSSPKPASAGDGLSAGVRLALFIVGMALLVAGVLIISNQTTTAAVRKVLPDPTSTDAAGTDAGASVQESTDTTGAIPIA